MPLNKTNCYIAIFETVQKMSQGHLKMLSTNVYKSYI